MFQWLKPKTETVVKPKLYTEVYATREWVESPDEWWFTWHDESYGAEELHGPFASKEKADTVCRLFVDLQLGNYTIVQAGQ